MSVGSQIKALRISQGMEVSDLSIAANIPATTIRGWEDGVAPTFGPALRRATRVLGVSLDNLAGAGMEEGL